MSRPSSGLRHSPRQQPGDGLGGRSRAPAGPGRGDQVRGCQVGGTVCCEAPGMWGLGGLFSALRWGSHSFRHVLLHEDLKINV